jgi:hypothetical protein
MKTMAELASNILSKRNLASIRNIGVPVWDPEELWLIVGDTELCLTVKGARYLTEVSRVHGVPLNLSKMNTYAELCEFRNLTNIRMGSALRGKLAGKLASGEIALQSREMISAFVNGSIEDFADAAARRSKCKAAGANVVPVAFTKK